MTHVYFVRHAEPNYENHDDLRRELTAKGMRDRELVTDFLMKQNIDAVLSSPYKRAVDTVKHFADRKGLPVITVDDFRERRVDSEWIADFDAFARRQWADFSYKRSDGETLAEVQNRNTRALQEVLAEYAGKSVAIGSHGTALSTIIHSYCPQFDYSEFTRIKSLMPWVVHFAFAGNACRRIEELDLFSGLVRCWINDLSYEA